MLHSTDRGLLYVLLGPPRAPLQHRSSTAPAPLQHMAAFSFDGFDLGRIDGLARPLLVARGSKGYAACAYVDVGVAEKFEEACIIFSGVATHADMAGSDVKKASPAALALGVTVGMKGADALELLR
tara:strand:- start:82 stop:459 length:378 start_codon:yes stop_codon:yes gene_type:complete